MHLVEGSVGLVQLVCGHEEKRVQIIQGNQVIRCPHPGCDTITKVEFRRDQEDRYSMHTYKIS